MVQKQNVYEEENSKINQKVHSVKAPGGKLSLRISNCGRGKRGVSQSKTSLSVTGRRERESRPRDTRKIDKGESYLLLQRALRREKMPFKSEGQHNGEKGLHDGKRGSPAQRSG